ncbi:MAG: site-specific integrase [Lachnospiraceae bacterium]|nr:site-specific integrase [Ruminococcus sp.]MCM1275816.1 site-specific integrase [Lachnospiraceae bacterium]
MANITPRRDKNGNITSYTIRVYHGYDSSGNRLKPFTTSYKPEKGMTAKQADKAAQRFADEFERECLHFGEANSSMRLSDFAPKYLEIANRTLSPATYEFYKLKIDSLIIPALGHLKLKDINPSHVQKFVNQLASMPKETRSGSPNKDGETISPSTVRRYLTVLQSVFKQAMKLGLIADSPAKMERLTLPKAQAPKIEIFTKQEAAQMLDALEDEDLQFQTLIQLAIFTGARRGELVALKFSDIDFEQRKITIERAAYKIKGEPLATKAPKDNETRTVTINESCVELLKMLKAEKIKNTQRLGSQWIGGNWVFTQWNGEMMNPMTPTKQFSKFLNRNGLKHRKFHSLRHTSATLLLYAGVNIKQVQGRLGHGDIETTNKYLHLIEEADIEAVNKLDIMLLPKAEKPDDEAKEEIS